MLASTTIHDFSRQKSHVKMRFQYDLNKRMHTYASVSTRAQLPIVVHARVFWFILLLFLFRICTHFFIQNDEFQKGKRCHYFFTILLLFASLQHRFRTNQHCYYFPIVHIKTKLSFHISLSFGFTGKYYTNTNVANIFPIPLFNLSYWATDTGSLLCFLILG